MSLIRYILDPARRGWLVFALLCLLWLPWLGDTPFYSKGEPREAIVAISMLRSGDWVLPVTAGWEYPFKPPLLAWLIAAIAAVFNGGVVTEFIARLPSALAAIAMVMAGFFWVRRAKGVRFATYMAAVTATSFEVFRAATACRHDMLLTAAMVGALYCLFNASETRRRYAPGLYAAAAALLTCAVLTKGPVGALLPCLAMGIYRLIRRENFFRVFFSLTLLAIVSFIIPALWYYFAWRRGGDVFLDIAWEENIGRLTGTMSYESHLKPFWYNFLTILAGMLPWTVFVVIAIPRICRMRPAPLSSRGLFALVSALTVIVFYCIPASKRSVYLLPAYPFMAYGVTVLILKIRDTPASTAFGWLIGFIGVLAPLFIMAESWMAILPGDLHFSGITPWIVLPLTVIASVCWLVQGARFGVSCIPVVYLLLLSYGAAVMPALFHTPLKTAQATEMFRQIKDSDAAVCIIGPNRYCYPVYWFNFYLDDRVRRLPSFDDAAALPAGSVVILPPETDTAPMEESGDWTSYELPFNPDTRRPVIFALRN